MSSRYSTENLKPSYKNCVVRFPPSSCYGLLSERIRVESPIATPAYINKFEHDQALLHVLPPTGSIFEEENTNDFAQTGYSGLIGMPDMLFNEKYVDYDPPETFARTVLSMPTTPETVYTVGNVVKASAEVEHVAHGADDVSDVSSIYDEITGPVAQPTSTSSQQVAASTPVEAVVESTLVNEASSLVGTARVDASAVEQVAASATIEFEDQFAPIDQASTSVGTTRIISAIQPAVQSTSTDQAFTFFGAAHVDALAAEKVTAATSIESADQPTSIDQASPSSGATRMIDAIQATVQSSPIHHSPTLVGAARVDASAVESLARSISALPHQVAASTSAKSANGAKSIDQSSNLAGVGLVNTVYAGQVVGPASAKSTALSTTSNQGSTSPGAARINPYSSDQVAIAMELARPSARFSGSSDERLKKWPFEHPSELLVDDGRTFTITSIDQSPGGLALFYHKYPGGEKAFLEAMHALNKGFWTGPEFLQLITPVLNPELVRSLQSSTASSNNKAVAAPSTNNGKNTIAAIAPVIVDQKSSDTDIVPVDANNTASAVIPPVTADEKLSSDNIAPIAPENKTATAVVTEANLEDKSAPVEISVTANGDSASSNTTEITAAGKTSSANNTPVTNGKKTSPAGIVPVAHDNSIASVAVAGNEPSSMVVLPTTTTSKSSSASIALIVVDGKSSSENTAPLPVANISVLPDTQLSSAIVDKINSSKSLKGAYSHLPPHLQKAAQALGGITNRQPSPSSMSETAKSTGKSSPTPSARAEEIATAAKFQSPNSQLPPHIQKIPPAAAITAQQISPSQSPNRHLPPHLQKTPSPGAIAGRQISPLQSPDNRLPPHPQKTPPPVEASTRRVFPPSYADIFGGPLLGSAGMSPSPTLRPETNDAIAPLQSPDSHLPPHLQTTPPRGRISTRHASSPPSIAEIFGSDRKSPSPTVRPGGKTGHSRTKSEELAKKLEETARAMSLEKKKKMKAVVARVVTSPEPIVPANTEAITSKASAAAQRLIEEQDRLISLFVGSRDEEQISMQQDIIQMLKDKIARG